MRPARGEIFARGARLTGWRFTPQRSGEDGRFRLSGRGMPSNAETVSVVRGFGGYRLMDTDIARRAHSSPERHRRGTGWAMEIAIPCDFCRHMEADRFGDNMLTIINIWAIDFTSLKNNSIILKY
jgi:hypothetical protein